MCLWGRVWLHPGGTPHPSRPEGDRLTSGGAAQGTLLRKPPAPGCVRPPLPKMCQAQWSWQWPDLWGTAGGTQHPGPSRSWAAPPRVPKLAPGGRRAQWESELGQEVAHGGLPYARGSSKGPACRTQCRGHGPLLPGGDVGGGSPFPGSITHWPSPKRAWGEGRIRLGMPRGALLLSTTLNLTSDQDSPERHGLTPTVQAMDTRALAGKPHSQGLSGDRVCSQEPSALRVPFWQDVPSGTSLEVAGRHRQEAQRVAGWPRAASRSPVTPARTTGAGGHFVELP